jgi:hypothetical protein
MTVSRPSLNSKSITSGLNAQSVRHRDNQTSLTLLEAQLQLAVNVAATGSLFPVIVPVVIPRFGRLSQTGISRSGAVLSIVGHEECVAHRLWLVTA